MPSTPLLDGVVSAPMRLEDSLRQDADSRFLVADGLVLDRGDQRAWLDGSQLEIGAKALALLEELMRNPQLLVTKDRLFDVGWPDQAVSDAVLTTAIRELRRALGDPARNPAWIETQHGKGYRFLPMVDARSIHPGRQRDAVAGPVASEGAPRFAIGRWVLGAIAVAGILLLGWLGLERGGFGETQQATSVQTDGSVAVLPFAVEGGEDWIGTAMSGRLTEVLKNAPDLVVAENGTVAALAEYDAPWEEAAAQGIDALVMGEVVVRDGTIVADVTIRNGAGEEVWSRRMSDRQEEVIALTERMAFETARALKIAGDPQKTAEMAEVGTKSVASFAAYSRAMQSLDSIDGYRRPGAIAQGIEDLREAVALDPTFGLATSSLSWFEYPAPYQPDAADAEAKANALAHLGITHARNDVERGVRQATVDLRNLKFAKARREFEALYERTRLTSSDQNTSILNQLAQIAGVTRDRSLADMVWREMTDYNLARGRIQFKDPVMIAHSKPMLLQYVDHLSQQDDTAIGTSYMHDALLLARETERAAALLADPDTVTGEPFAALMRIKQACAEGRDEDARTLARQALGGDPSPAWSAWKIAQVAGLSAEARRLAPSIRDNASQRALLRMMYEPGFDASPYPLLRNALREAGVEELRVPRLHYYCRVD